MDYKKQKADLNLGLGNEPRVLSIINKTFSESYKTKNQYNYFDYRNDNLKIDYELKTRRVYKGQYPTIFFAKHKLESGRKRKAEGITNRVIYLFSLLSKKDKTKQKLYYWEDMGTDEDFKITQCGNFARGDKAKPLIDLDITKLKLFKYCV